MLRLEVIEGGAGELQRLKPESCCGVCGTTEVVPSRNGAPCAEEIDGCRC
jgi:hypothetical protein